MIAEVPDTIPKLIRRNYERWTQRNAMAMKNFGVWQRYSWQEYYDRVKYFSLGLLSLGIDWTVLSRTRWPDHGLFARGRSRLYVHRGTGFYGFPLRVGVPGEASVLELRAR